MGQLNENLGWDASFKDNTQKQVKSREVIFNKKEPQQIYFHDFLDKIILLYVIRIEVVEKFEEMMDNESSSE